MGVDWAFIGSCFGHIDRKFNLLYNGFVKNIWKANGVNHFLMFTKKQVDNTLVIVVVLMEIIGKMKVACVYAMFLNPEVQWVESKWCLDVNIFQLQAQDYEERTFEY